MITIDFHGRQLQVEKTSSKYFAVDRCGTLFGFQKKPEVKGEQWLAPSCEVEYFGFFDTKKAGIYWNESLIEV